MKKKVAAGLLSAVLAVSALSACFTDYSGEIRSEQEAFCGGSLDTERGVVKISDIAASDYVPIVPGLPEGAYHVYDYQFFFRNLQLNVAVRLAGFASKNTTEEPGKQNPAYAEAGSLRDETIEYWNLQSPAMQFLVSFVVFTGGFIQKNLNANKAIWIEREIGRRPVLAFGNSGSDTSMMNYVLDERNPYPSAAYMVVADDNVREWGTQNWEEKSAQYEEQGYVPISMKNDFAEIYPEPISRADTQYTEPETVDETIDELKEAA